MTAPKVNELAVTPATTLLVHRDPRGDLNVVRLDPSRARRQPYAMPLTARQRGYKQRFYRGVWAELFALRPSGYWQYQQRYLLLDAKGRPLLYEGELVTTFGKPSLWAERQRGMGVTVTGQWTPAGDVTWLSASKLHDTYAYVESFSVEDALEQFGGRVDELYALALQQLPDGVYTEGARPNPRPRARRRLDPYLDGLDELAQRYVITEAQYRATEKALRRGARLLTALNGVPGLPLGPGPDGRPRWLLLTEPMPDIALYALLRDAGFQQARQWVPSLPEPALGLVLPWREDVPLPEPWW